MILKALRRFRDKTYEKYELEHRNLKPAWMDKVMELHERSGFLFYFDESLEEKEAPFSLLVRGDLVRGETNPGTLLYLYSGEGVLLGKACPAGNPEEKEEGRRGLLTRKRNEFRMEILSYRGCDSKDMDHRIRVACFQDICARLSLISDILMPEKAAGPEEQEPSGSKEKTNMKDNG